MEEQNMGLDCREKSKTSNSHFKSLVDRVTTIAQANGIIIKGYHSNDLPLFNSLSAKNQETAIHHLEAYLSSLELAEKNTSKSRNQERALWAALSTWGLHQPSEMFSFFSADDVIEIYNLEGIQIWRNFNFMRICSYTLEEVYCIEWFKRYQRDEEKIKECQEKVGNLLSGNTPAIYMVDVEEHLVQETLSSERFVLSLKHRWIARLKNSSGQIAAWIVASKVNIVRKESSPFLQNSIPKQDRAPLHLA